MRRFVVPCILLLIAASAAIAAASPRRQPSGVPMESRAVRGQSIGYPWHGRLSNGVVVAQSDVVRWVDKYASSPNHFATSEMASILDRGARAAAKVVPATKLTIGELSRAGGGNIIGHHSHENGRDADVCPYLLDAQSRPVAPPRYTNIGASGRGHLPVGEVHFDDARNWAFVSAMLDGPQSPVQFIFTSRTIRARLLAEGQRQGASSELLSRAATALFAPRRGHPHRDHFHVRVFCAPEDRPTCRDRPPYWSWYSAPPNAMPWTIIAPAPFPPVRTATSRARASR